MLKAIIIGVVLIWLLIRISGRTGKADKTSRTNHPTRPSRNVTSNDDDGWGGDDLDGNDIPDYMEMDRWR